MLYKVLLVFVLLAVHHVDGQRILRVSELIENYCEDNTRDNSTNGTSSCDEYDECYMFDLALANLTSNFVINVTADSTLSFHHKIMQGLENVSIVGYNNPTVYCFNTTIIIGGLQFDSCTNCTIEGITWSGCGGIIDSNNYPVLEFYNSSNIKIQNCIFKHSKGQAVTLSGMAGDVSIEHCTFSHNKYSGIHGGAAIHIRNPQVANIIRNCNFTNNGGTSIVYIGQSNDQSFGNISFHDLVFSDNEGVAVYLNHQNLYMYGDFCFKQNTAENGAGMFISNESNVYFTENSFVEFRENTVSDSGGAIFLSNNSTISFGQRSEFINNQAGNNGGAIALHNESNIDIDTTSSSNKPSNFSVHDGLSSMGSCVLFLNNSAINSGGAIYLNGYSTAVFRENFTFINNKASNGSALALYDNCHVTSFIGHITFKENEAMDYGGAILSDSSNITFSNNSTVAFYNNSPWIGTLYSRSTSHVIEYAGANVTFNNNPSKWHYGDKYTESNDVIIDASGIVRCSDYREYYICIKKQCFCKDLKDVKSYSAIIITDDLVFSSPINLEGLDNISLIGHNNSTINYKENGELTFTSCENLKIKNLAWVQHSEKNPIPRLTVVDVYNVTVEKCHFHHSKGQAILLTNVSGNINICHCKFLNDTGSNKHGAAIYYNTSDYSEATNVLTISNCHFKHTEDASSLIYLEVSKSNPVNVILRDSVFIDNQGVCIYGINLNNLFIQGTVTFENNRAESGAGIFTTNNSYVTFCSNSIVNFSQNVVNNNGGAIHLNYFSTIASENHSHIQFSNNKAKLGGAIYSTSNSTIILKEDSEIDFSGNKAQQDGGAIYSKTDCMIALKGSVSFSNNNAIQGGAIYSKDNSNVTFQSNSYVVFSGNEVLINGRDNGNGGSLYSDNSSIMFDGDCTILFNNSKVYNGNGGAIYSNSSDVSFMGNSAVEFNENVVFDGFGGAIFFAHESNAEFQGMSDIKFNNNKAKNGGALHFQNSTVSFANNSHAMFSNNIADSLGGGIYLRENDISFNDDSTVDFDSNMADNGGALYAIMNCIISNIGNSIVDFSNNKAKDGGAIYFESNSNLSIAGSSEITFNKNEATENGGGIFSDNSNITFGRNSSANLTNNQATQGGAIYLTTAKVIFESRVTFSSNEASKHGGSLYSTTNSIIMFEASCLVIFDKNIALSGDGGGIYTDNSNTSFTEKSKVTFTENEATDGGALHFQFQSNVQFEYNSSIIFSNNTATSGGAIHFFESCSKGIFGGTAKLIFCNNTATTSGGAICFKNSVSSFEKEYFNNESILIKASATVLHCAEKFTNTSNIFYQNNANVGGAIFIEASNITFDSNSMIFDSNMASQDGGAIYLSDQFNLTFANNCNVNFSYNSASDHGGAIYGKFSTEMGKSKIDFSSSNIRFQKNHARIAGNSVYINLPKECNSTCLDDSIVNAINSNIKDNIVTSPNQLKLYHPAKCIDNDYNDTDNEEDEEECKFYYIDNIMLGQEIPLIGCMYDYYNQPADPAQFHVNGKSDDNEDDDDDFMLAINTTFISCNHTVPDIRINSDRQNNPEQLSFRYSMDIALFVNRLSESKPVSVNLKVELTTCHPGFWYHGESCICYNALDIVICSNSDSTIRRGYWFGSVKGKPTVAFCPINYCNFTCCESSNGYYHLSPLRNNQCRSHRTGVACGNCGKGYVIPYDSAECISIDECTTALIALVVVLTVVYWIVLFVVIFVLMHFKVEIGYLYGLTYYYSIIDILLSQNLHYSNGFFTIVNILSSIAKVTPQFLGSLCLFTTMNGIDQQFIHFVHPVAFSLILIIIILLAKFSGRLTIFLSKVIIPIICFLLLLSYTSVATTSLLLMRPLQFHEIDQIYTYLSPSLEYFHGRHLVYAIVAILSTIFIVIFPPFLLLSEPFLNRKINFVKIKPLLDQFQGCYKDKYRSFAGFYMICRLVIIALIISNSSNDFIIQYSLITTCVMAALIHLIVRPYAHTVLNIFDGIVLHIMILVAVLPFVEHYDSFGSDLILTLAYLLVLLPLTVFIIMEVLIHRENIKEMIQNIKSFKLSKESNNNNEVQLNDMNREIGIIVDENMRRNAIIVDVDQPEEEQLPKIPWSRDSFIEVLNEIKD